MNATTKIEYKGKFITKSDIAKMGNLPWYLVDQRLKYGWDVDKIINTPIRKLKRTRRIAKETCDPKTAEECLHCKRNVCIYDEDFYGKENECGENDTEVQDSEGHNTN